MVRMVEVELSTVERVDINAPAMAAKIKPLKPAGTRVLTNTRYAWSGRWRWGKSLNAAMPGKMKKKGVMIWRKPAQTTPIRAFHSSLAPRTRCTICWLVQLYQMPTVRKPVKTPVNGNGFEEGE